MFLPMWEKATGIAPKADVKKSSWGAVLEMTEEWIKTGHKVGLELAWFDGLRGKAGTYKPISLSEVLPGYTVSGTMRGISGSIVESKVDTDPTDKSKLLKPSAERDAYVTSLLQGLDGHEKLSPLIRYGKAFGVGVESEHFPISVKPAIQSFANAVLSVFIRDRDMNPPSRVAVPGALCL